MTSQRVVIFLMPIFGFLFSNFNLPAFLLSSEIIQGISRSRAAFGVIFASGRVAKQFSRRFR